MTRKDSSTHLSSEKLSFYEQWPGIALVILSGSLLAAYFSRFGTLPDKSEAWGQFGDFMGGVVNPFVGIFTILLLIRTLRLQRQELAETRAEMVRQGAETSK